MKREVLKLSSFFGIIATSFKEMQLDPPETLFLTQKAVTLTFINFSSMLESGLFDGVAKTLLTDMHRKLLHGEFGHVMSQYINQNQSGMNQQMNGKMGQYGTNQQGGKFRRFSLLDLFDEQYGHLQRNELLEI